MSQMMQSAHHWDSLESVTQTEINGAIVRHATLRGHPKVLLLRCPDVEKAFNSEGLRRILNTMLSGRQFVKIVQEVGTKSHVGAYWITVSAVRQLQEAVPDLNGTLISRFNAALDSIKGGAPDEDFEDLPAEFASDVFVPSYGMRKVALDGSPVVSPQPPPRIHRSAQPSARADFVPHARSTAKNADLDVLDDNVYFWSAEPGSEISNTPAPTSKRRKPHDEGDFVPPEPRTNGGSSKRTKTSSTTPAVVTSNKFTLHIASSLNESEPSPMLVISFDAATLKGTATVMARKTPTEWTHTSLPFCNELDLADKGLIHRMDCLAVGLGIPLRRYILLPNTQIALPLKKAKEEPVSTSAPEPKAMEMNDSSAVVVASLAPAIVTSSESASSPVSPPAPTFVELPVTAPAPASDPSPVSSPAPAVEPASVASPVTEPTPAPAPELEQPIVASAVVEGAQHSL